MMQSTPLAVPLPCPPLSSGGRWPCLLQGLGTRHVAAFSQGGPSYISCSPLLQSSRHVTTLQLCRHATTLQLSSIAEPKLAHCSCLHCPARRSERGIRYQLLSDQRRTAQAYMPSAHTEAFTTNPPPPLPPRQKESGYYDNLLTSNIFSCLAFLLVVVLLLLPVP